jgi:hypothetical protein
MLHFLHIAISIASGDARRMDISLIARYAGIQAPAGLAVLAPKTLPTSGPTGTDGSAQPPDKMLPSGAGIYGPDGKLPQIQGAGCSFVAYA